MVLRKSNLLSNFLPPSQTGTFGSVLADSNHAGIDFCAPQGTSVPCLMDGYVAKIAKYKDTGSAESLLSGSYYMITISIPSNLAIVYTGLTSDVIKDFKIYQTIRRGKSIGKINSPDNRYKDLPVFPLHIQAYEADKISIPNWEHAHWELNQPKPEALLNPSTVIPEIFLYFKAIEEAQSILSDTNDENEMETQTI